MTDLKKIVELIYSLSEYKQGFGAKCPLCNSYNSPSNSGVKKKANGKLRYHKCQNCGLKYKSLEKQSVQVLVNR